jgi:phosphoribosylformylglycinamidine synthase II
VTDAPITPELVAEHGLKPDEYQRILDALGREPTLVELGVFSVMWSEHCSYKSSRVHLARLPTDGPAVLIGPGENAGAVDLGDGLAAVFKMESHNHPSYIEPYQGAATGVGGILRDVFTMGARPVANLNSLRFGRMEHPRTKHLVHGVVAGIGGYGNCMGIPTVGGELRFHPSYDGNCLVNAFTCGVVRADRIFLGTAAGEGNPVFYVGARTGRDGIHGATMASESFGEGSEEKRPTVQVGDPFQEKLLLEACLELMESDCIVGIQDMGAAGLTSSSVEMAGRGGAGLLLELDRIPTREVGMTPYELLLSESQERMLVVIQEGREDEVFRVFEKWDLTAAVVGRVTGDGTWRCTWGGEEVAAIPVDVLTDAAPKYDRPQARPPWQDAVQAPPALPPEPADPAGELAALLAHPELAERRWIWRQYDHQVGTDTVVLPGADAALVRIKGTDKFLAFATDCNGRHVYLDPHLGAAAAVAEGCRNLACVGATPLGLTDCLNFGNPENPAIMWQFARAIDGMAEGCRELSVPVVSGNVSLYNETDGISILPTPSVAVVGLYEGPAPAVSARFAPGQLVALLGEVGGHLGGSLYLWARHGLEQGAPPAVDWAAERALQAALRRLVREGLAACAHDLSDGGLAVALAECCFGEHPVGAAVTLPGEGRADARLFGEDAGRALIAFDPADEAAVRGACAGVPFAVIGRTGGSRLVIRDGDAAVVDAPVAGLYEGWANALPEALK